MKRLVLSLMLAFLVPTSFAATVYDISDPNTNICNNGQLNGITYTCSQDIVLDNKDTIIFSRTELIPQNSRPLLKLTSGSIKFENNNQSGTATTPIDIESHSDAVFKGSTVYGNIESSGGQVKSESGSNLFYGDVKALGDIILKKTTVYGDVTSTGGQVKFETNPNEVFGDIHALSDVVLKNTQVCGVVTSTGGEFKAETQNSIYAQTKAIDAHGKATIKNSSVCGEIKSSSDDFSNASFYCGIDDPNCNYASSNCPTNISELCSFPPPEPPINQNPQFEFGTLADNNCTISSPGPDNKQVVTCTLNFNNTYDIAKPKPLVFVMPTIDASLSVRSNGTTELPSTASVINTTWQSATIVQEIAPSAKKKTNNITYLNAPMSGQSDPLKNSNHIDYFVIEEGVISLNNGESQIVAGLVNTNTAASQISSERNNADIIRYEDYGLDSFNSKPGILVQPQTKNNTSAWFTGMARGVGVDSFSLALEKSEVIKNNSISSKENVAFVAGEGSGFIQGARFFLGNAETRVTTTLSEKVISPIEIGCEEFTSIVDAGFDAPPILVANKNSRSGNNGGWIRRCDITKDKVYFIVEEDMDKDSERSHVAEDVGFFMFDRPNELGICEGFNNKSPVQTWLGSGGSLEINGSQGLSPQIVGALREDGQRYVGFLDTNTFDRTNSACEGQKCLGLDDLLINKEALEDVPDNLGNSLVIPQVNNVTSLPIIKNGVKIYEYDSITIGDGGVVEIEAGKYKIGKLDINETGKLKVKTGDTVTIFTKNLSVNNNGYAGIPIVNSIGEKPVLAADTHFRVNVLINGANHVSFNGEGATFVGLVYSEQLVDLSGSAKVYGAVSAQNINMSSSALVHAETSCIVPADDYEIEISPATDLALMCGDDSPQFTINTSNNGVAERLGVTVGIAPDADEFDVSVLQGQGSGTYPNYFSNDDGELTLKVVAKETANIDFDSDYKLTATLVDDSGKEVESQFKFVPFKFSLVDGNTPTNRLNVIAGQATPTVTKVLACDSGDSIVVAENYVGEADDEITISHELDSSWSGSDGTLTYLPEFKKGSASTDLTISESGLFNVTLKDSSFDCTGFAGCPEDGNYDVEGSFSVYSRPWKFAICTNNSSDGNSNEKDSDSFAAAGSPFDVYTRPIKHTDSSSVCTDDNLLTNNYFESTASVKVTTTLDTPSITDYPAAELGDLTPVAQLTKQISPNDQANKGYKFESLKYSEVGSFNFIATETGSFYGSILGGFSGSKSIGRFYPKYFVQGTPEWNVANQKDIAYLSQPYDSTVHQVYPMASGEGDTDNVLNNYRFFNTELQAKFGVLDDSNTDNSFLLDTGSGTWSADRKHWLLNDNAAELQRVVDSDDVSRRDTPFNTSDANSTTTNFGLTIEGTDPVSFTDSDPVTSSVAFPIQPPARYGRMALDDIGGNSGSTLTIPLRAEFWNGDEFVPSRIDSRSTFDGSKVCKQVIWHSEGKTITSATLSGVGNVKGGEEEVTANQNTPADTDSPREQVRLWLRMDDSEPDNDGGNNISCSGGDQDQPWLQYNWRGKTCGVDRDEQCGDEDPSTVVTFGIYRGNDRVIYRGESGLTGQ
ncbi:hypothetical protein Q8W38_17535 [Vibrio splendidus]|uniref:DUF6701 domain-containing protein n=1 Tax=Vibrio splendidus TaxID=29497 RepID=A0ABD5ADE2_VIBSP|nr:DUF6701 domain-containing protein [Vibrio splendidus]MDP2491155.1 hypothetical protein [Vibrio splendidus]PMO48204.1 hypothetical protein BCT08_08055 [Vibrio splendidus]